MRDYMTALHDRFKVTTALTEELAERVEKAHDTLHAELSREQQRLLLRYLDAENEFREEAKLDSFIAGYRLADGIHGELDTIPAFSLAGEEEERARKIFEMKRREEHGKTPGER